MNVTKLQNVLLGQLKKVCKFPLNNIAYRNTSSNILSYITCNNRNGSFCANVAQDLALGNQQSILLNYVTKRTNKVQNNFSRMLHPWIGSSVILCNGKKYAEYKTYCSSHCYNNVRYFSSANIEPIANVPFQYNGIFKAISESTPVTTMQDLLLWMHDYTGLPWWLVIVLTSILMRTTVTLPLSFYQQRILAKLENLRLEMNEIVKKMKVETNYGIHQYNWSQAYARRLYNHSVKKQWNNLIIRENCHPAKTALLAIVQIPLWVSLSMSIRNLCYMLPEQNISAYTTYQEFTKDGFLWITSLTAADPFVLPIAMGLCNLAIIEITYMSRMKETALTKYLTPLFRIFAIGMIPVAMCVPSCLSLYWATSSAFGLLQNLVLLSPRLRRLAGVPATASESSHPYTLLRGKIISRCGFKEKSENPPKK